jgi:hypothetical protein
MVSSQIGAYWSLWLDCFHASLEMERQTTWLFFTRPSFLSCIFNIFVPCIMIHDCHLFVAAKPAYYNYICAMLLLNGLSLFGCLLVASGAGFGLWYVKNTIFKIYANLFPCKKSV